MRFRSSNAASRERYGKSLLCVSRLAYGLRSFATTLRPARQASNATVPQPLNGSYKSDPRVLNSLTSAPAIEDFNLPMYGAS